MNRENFTRAYVILLVVLISVLFVEMIRGFLMTLLLAAIFSGVSQPLFTRLLRLFNGRGAAASFCTLLVLLVVIVGPLLFFFGILVSQAVQISQAVGPWIQTQISQPDKFSELIDSVPVLERLEPYRAQILTKLGQVVGALGNFLVSGLSATTRGTVAFFFHFFILLYAMFFFLKDGGRILNKILYYVPMTDEDERRMMDKFVSVSRATLKGTFIIGIVQGGLAGIGFAVAGIGGAVFWATIMTVLSIIPGIGAALVWVPAVVYLFATGHALAAVLLALYCGLIVGTADNFLRPRLVGRDAKMGDLMILLSTLGGIALFGVAGFIIGPILAALFITIWEIYGVVFRDFLPKPRTASTGGRENAGDE
jgi:predicted PurR-regulated permease PerM